MSTHTEHGVTMELSSTVDRFTGTVVVEVTAGAALVAEVVFSSVNERGEHTGPHAAVRQTGDRWEFDVVRGVAGPALVEARAVLHDGRVAAAPAVEIPARGATGADLPAADIAPLDVQQQGGSFTVSVQPQDTLRWRCWARRGEWPTRDGAGQQPVLDEYLLIDSAAATTQFTTRAFDPGDDWYFMARGYNTSGLPGPREEISLEVQS